MDVHGPLPPLGKYRGRHFLTDLDYTRAELEDLLVLSRARSRSSGDAGPSPPSSPASTWR